MKMTQEKREETVLVMLELMAVVLDDPDNIATIQIVHKDGSVGTIPVPPAVGCEIDLDVFTPTGTGYFAVNEG